jgi:hypothetical protein
MRAVPLLITAHASKVAYVPHFNSVFWKTQKMAKSIHHLKAKLG